MIDELRSSPSDEVLRALDQKTLPCRPEVVLKRVTIITIIMEVNGQSISLNQNTIDDVTSDVT